MGLETFEQSKKLMRADRYRALIERKALLASRLSPRQDTALELYAGRGGLTRIYENTFRWVITNDINPDAQTDYVMPAMELIQEVLLDLGKIDLIDFDCYGSPAFEVQEFFGVVEDKMKPIVVAISDGMGQRLKRIRDERGIKMRYLVTATQFDLRHSWRFHPQLLDNLVKSVASEYKMNCYRESIFQAKGMNAAFGVWLLT